MKDKTVERETEVLQEHWDVRSMMKQQKEQKRPKSYTKGFLNPFALRKAWCGRTFLTTPSAQL